MSQTDAAADQELVDRIWAGIERDVGYVMAYSHGQDPAKMTDEQLRGWSRLAKCLRSDRCPECGQTLPDA